MLSAGAVPVLTAQLLHPTSSDLLLRSNIASTLLQIYRFCPEAPLDSSDAASLAAQLTSLKADRELTVLLLRLLDVWRQPLLSLRIDPTFGDSLPVVRAHMEALRSEHLDARADATAFLQAHAHARGHAHHVHMSHGHGYAHGHRHGYCHGVHVRACLRHDHVMVEVQRGEARVGLHAPHEMSCRLVERAWRVSECVGK